LVINNKVSLISVFKTRQTFFTVTEREMKSICPQQILLTCCIHAQERALTAPESANS